MLYTVKIPFESKNSINSFLNKQKLKTFITSRTTKEKGGWGDSEWIGKI